MATLIKLNNRGAAHIVVPLLAVVLVGIVGTYMLVKSHASVLPPLKIAPAPVKADSPATDLTHYPKLTAAVPAGLPTSVSQSDTAEITAQVNNTDGTVTTTYFDGDGTVTPQTLYQQLKTHGVQGLKTPGASATQTSSANHSVVLADAPYDHCTDGNATAECVNGYPIYWQNNGHGHPQVYFIDSTGSKWPVDTATYKWNQAQGIDSNYAWKTCPRISGIYCVPVVEGYYGSSLGGSNVAGQTVTVTRGNALVSASIKLNDSASNRNNAYGHRQEICHEEGHALGLNHNFSRSSCLYSAVINSAGAQYPSSDDFNFLARIYSVHH